MKPALQESPINLDGIRFTDQEIGNMRSLIERMEMQNAEDDAQMMRKLFALAELLHSVKHPVILSKDYCPARDDEMVTKAPG